MNKTIQAVVFDFDGVLAVTEMSHFAAFTRTAEELGLEMPGSFFDKMIGGTDDECADELAGHWKGQVSREEILQRKQQIYRESAILEARLVPGILEFLTELRERTIPMGIATNSGRADIMPFIERYRLHDFFCTIRTLEDVSRPKPQPDIYQLVFRDMGISPENIVVFEDSPAGSQAAHRAGARIIGLLTTFRPEQLPLASTHWPDFSKRHLWQELLS
ncbi:MAG: HAD family phosphatase [Deltaproteobacteria bacterium]|nr:HAD family phosphatase [Deltaproteobacteria bacterium]